LGMPQHQLDDLLRVDSGSDVGSVFYETAVLATQRLSRSERMPWWRRLLAATSFTR